MPRQRLRMRHAGARLGAAEAAPLGAAIVNLDAARITGVALYIRGVLRGFDEVDARDPMARSQLMREVLDAAAVRELPVAVVCETPWGGFASAALSLTATVALWKDTWLALQQPAHRFIELTVGEWRRAAFGKRSLTREQARAYELQHATARIRSDAPRLRDEPLGSDAAAAICMGSVTCRSSIVRERLELPARPKRARKRKVSA